MAGVPMDSPMGQMVAMRLAQPQPVGTGQQLPTGGGMAPEAPDGSPGPPIHAGVQGRQEAGPMGEMASQAVQGGNEQAMLMFLKLLKKEYPELKLSDYHNGEAELTGPTQEQFLGSVLARSHGAKVHHVRNRGRGQRLHVRF